MSRTIMLYSITQVFFHWSKCRKTFPGHYASLHARQACSALNACICSSLNIKTCAKNFVYGVFIAKKDSLIVWRCISRRGGCVTRVASTMCVLRCSSCDASTWTLLSTFPRWELCFTDLFCYVVPFPLRKSSIIARARHKQLRFTPARSAVLVGVQAVTRTSAENWHAHVFIYGTLHVSGFS